MSEPMKGSLKDQHIHWRLKSKWLTPMDYVTGATCTSAGPATLTCGYANSDATARLWQVGRRDVYGARIATTAATLSYVWRPWDMDNRHPFYIRHWWTSDSALANVATFNTTFATLTTDGVMATPSTGITRAIVSVAKSASAHAPTFTRLGAVAALSTGALAFQTLSPETQVVNIAVSVSSLTNGAVTTDFVWLLGTELLYTPRLTAGDGSGKQGTYAHVPLSTMAAPPTGDQKIR